MKVRLLKFINTKSHNKLENKSDNIVVIVVVIGANVGLESTWMLRGLGDVWRAIK